MADLTPGEHLDRFEVTGVLAKSGMATLYRARDSENGHTVVLKVPHLEYASDIVFHERFRREEDIGRRLGHPGIVKIVGPAEKSRLYLAMEYVDGETLRERLKRAGRLPVAEAVRIGIAIADTLEYLHEHGIVHRDLKPENVMLLGDGNIKLLDFGIALDATQRRIEWSGLSQAVGTPDYMAPEQQQGRPGDARTDLYALAVMLYEMLTGSLPSHETTEGGAPLRIRVLRPDVPAALEQAVAQAMEADPSRRPSRALEMRDALAHPASVVVHHAPRSRSALDALSRPQRFVLVGAAIAVYALFFWLLAR